MEKLKLNSIRIDDIEGFRVVRDDLIPGGTKARVIGNLLETGEEYIYVSPAYGYAQVALAISIGALATIFVAKRKRLHARTQEAKDAGAKIMEVDYGYMTVLNSRARKYAAENGAHLLPFGLDFPGFISDLAEVAKQISEPDEVWLAAGSGTLARALRLAWPDTVIHAVQVGSKPILPSGAKLYKAAERFEQDAKNPPTFPSCSNYDAKVWGFMKQFASPGAMFWNVAG